MVKKAMLLLILFVLAGPSAFPVATGDDHYEPATCHDLCEQASRFVGNAIDFDDPVCTEIADSEPKVKLDQVCIGGAIFTEVTGASSYAIRVADDAGIETIPAAFSVDGGPIAMFCGVMATASVPADSDITVWVLPPDILDDLEVCIGGAATGTISITS